ncbi:U32 family peptidase [Streptococcaceae bacterium ESL0729]|nr:U32 family peptidase [Streptococcaceae bacterium ESL0729]
MIKITATAQSFEQAKKLLDAGVDTLYIGEGEYGLRLPKNFTWAELEEITKLAHENQATVTVAVNALMHPDKMRKIKDYLDFLEKIGVDLITVGDAGVIHVLKRDGYKLPYFYDASTMVTSARQVNFWSEHGACGAVLARELPKDELNSMQNHLKVPGEILVYGATIIHQTKRPLLQNYYNFIKSDEDITYERGLFLSEPNDEETHYSVFEDSHGTHIFASDDVDMMSVLGELTDMNFNHWKLEGIYCPGDNFVAIAKLFIEARSLIEAHVFTADKAYQLDEEVRKLHPRGRSLGRGFYDFAPDDIK